MRIIQNILNMLLVISIILTVRINAYSKEIGKVIQVEGSVERSSITTGKRYTIEYGSTLLYGQKLRTGPQSLIEILLNNGTSVLIRENSSVFFFNIRMKKNQPPTKLRLFYGKIMITPKQIFYDRSLILTTQTAAASVVDAKFSAVASEYETKILAYNSKVGVANINPLVKKAFVIIEGEEVSIRKNASPSLPVSVPSDVINSWFDYYDITDDKKYIIKSIHEEGFIDWILRKREF